MNTVLCPCCGHDTGAPKKRAYDLWLPAQDALLAKWDGIVSRKVVAAAFGTSPLAVQQRTARIREGRVRYDIVRRVVPIGLGAVSGGLGL